MEDDAKVDVTSLLAHARSCHVHAKTANHDILTTAVKTPIPALGMVDRAMNNRQVSLLLRRFASSSLLLLTCCTSAPHAILGVARAIMAARSMP